jgi:hypothetical protein
MRATTFRRTVPVYIAGKRTQIDPAALTAHLREMEQAMKIPVWFTTEGEILCRDCADDAKAAGQPWLRIAHIAPRLVECAWCHQTITKESKR